MRTRVPAQIYPGDFIARLAAVAAMAFIIYFVVFGVAWEVNL